MQDSNKGSKSGNLLLGVLLALALSTGAFMAGAKASQVSYLSQQEASLLSWLFGKDQTDTKDVDLSEFWRVWNLMEEKFTSASSSESVSVDARIEGAIMGMVEAYGDPYTVYMPPEDAAYFEEDISGNFSGVGMEVGMRDGVITVIAPLAETPAEQAGILSGDVIVRIDDESTERMTIDEAVRRIRGEKGTDVTLSIYREGDTEFRTISITRDTIIIPTVKTEQDGDVFIIALYSFNAIAEEKMNEALAEYKASGADKLIIDLRGNPGGYLQGAVEIASHFLDAGEIVVREQSSEDDEQTFRSRQGADYKMNPSDFVVLVNGGSASASEILAGALHDHEVATIIGEPTFGKGSVQELVPLPNNASLKVTVARWLTPNGISISDGGLTPDIVIEMTSEDREADRDPQKDAAIRFLHGETVASQELVSQFDQLGS